ncbi:MAG: SMP-30/gluconolactonase/LRE family protein [Bacteroidetes bacterium]|nr:SMP-30/gluconolactonase/LRE family protein [Bacteroidota bacterium]
MTYIRFLYSITFLIALCTPLSVSAQQMIGSIQVVDDALNELIDPESQLEILADGFIWTEGPVWIEDEGYLLFSDVYSNQIFQWQPDSSAKVFLEPSGYTGTEERGGGLGSNGLTLDSDGHLLIAQHGDRRIAQFIGDMMNPQPEFLPIAQTYQGAKLNSPNDLVFHSNGTLYFTDPAYGLIQGLSDPSKELDYQGVFSVTPNGTISLLDSVLSHPNGIAFSPDEKTLYVSNSNAEEAIWMAYDVLPDGKVDNRRVFFDATPMVGGESPGIPDGLKVDVNGNIFATGPGGILVFHPDGTHLGTINTTRPTANCTFGDDGRMLYVTAEMYLLRVPLLTQGAIP